MITTGQEAPAFTLPTDNGGTITLSKLKGKKIILYFYPKDDTPGCTQEACEFRDSMPRFEATNYIIIGVSKDSPKSHDKFKEKYALPFTLASDEDTSVCQAYGVWVEKMRYGKKYVGIERSTFLIDENGIIQGIWRNVKVEDHVTEMLKACTR